MPNGFLKEIQQNKNALLFIGKMLGLFALMYGIYEYVIIKYTSLDSQLIELIIQQAGSLLQITGYELLIPNPEYTSHIGIAGTTGVIVGNTCDGLSLFILFASFLIIFEGKWWFKSIYIVIGIALIHILNVFRVYALALIVLYSPESLDFHHSYTFTLFIYLVIFGLWVKRVNIFSKYEI